MPRKFSSPTASAPGLCLLSDPTTSSITIPTSKRVDLFHRSHCSNDPSSNIARFFQRRSDHVYSEHADLFTRRLRHILHSGPHRFGTRHGSVRSGEEWAGSGFSHLPGSGSQATRCIHVGSDLLHHAARKECLTHCFFLLINLPSESVSYRII